MSAERIIGGIRKLGPVSPGVAWMVLEMTAAQAEGSLDTSVDQPIAEAPAGVPAPEIPSGVYDSMVSSAQAQPLDVRFATVTAGSNTGATS